MIENTQDPLTTTYKVYAVIDGIDEELTYVNTTPVQQMVDFVKRNYQDLSHEQFQNQLTNYVRNTLCTKRSPGILTDTDGNLIPLHNVEKILVYAPDD